MNTRGKKQLVLGAAIVLVGAVAPSLAIVSSGTGTDVSKAPVDNSVRAAKLAAAIRAEADARPATASVEDLEGVIVFALSREDYPPMIMDTALNIVESSPNASAALKQAVANVRLAALRRKLKRGTGAVALRGGGFGGGGGVSSFSAPIVSVGGGSSNYAS